MPARGKSLFSLAAAAALGTWSLAPSVMVLSLLMLLHGPVGVSPTADMQQCPRSLYDCSTLETTLTGVADVILTPDFVSSVHDDMQVDEICRFLKTPLCSEAVLAECKGEVVYASGAVKARIQYVCGNRQTRKGMQELKHCYRKYVRHFKHCRVQRSHQLGRLAWQSPSTTDQHPWCNLTKEYIMCVYSVMALGCTLAVADEYMTIVNMSYPVVQAILGYGCSFGHPLDVLRTTSTVSVLTSAPMRGSDPSADRPSLRSEAGSPWLWSGPNIFTVLLSVVFSSLLSGGCRVSRVAVFAVVLSCFSALAVDSFLPKLDPS